MLIPRYSIRQLFITMVACGIFFTVAAAAVRGHRWAISVTAGVMSVAVVFLFFGLIFLGAGVLTGFSTLFGGRDLRKSSVVKSPASHPAGPHDPP